MFSVVMMMTIAFFSIIAAAVLFVRAPSIVAAAVFAVTAVF